MKVIYEKCPVLENERFQLRLVEEKDAKELLAIYSDKNALPYFNSDNCNGDNFYYATEERVREAIRYWLWEYGRKGFVRFSVKDKETEKIIGTIELFNRKAEDYYTNCGLLRIDVISSYEQHDILESLCSLILLNAYELFECSMIATKAAKYAVERIEALKKCGFEVAEEYIIGHDNRRYYDYWVHNKSDVGAKNR
jgi:[ribosomal protein S5]-alanine N-acetyltransferase